MCRRLLPLFLILILCVSCTRKKAAPPRPKHSVYEMYYQRALNSLNNFNASRDSVQLVAALHYMDSASVQKSLRNQLIVPRITLLLYQKKLAVGKAFISTLDSSQFQRPYMKTMYVNFIDALIYNRTHELELRNSTMQKAVDSVLGFLKSHPKNKDAIADLFSLKMYSELPQKVFSEMDEYKKQHPDTKVIIDNLEKSFKTAVNQQK